MISPLHETHVVLLRQSPVVNHLLNVCQALLCVGFQHRKTVFNGIQKWLVSGQKPDFPLCVWILDCPVAWRVVEQEDGSFVAEDGGETSDEAHHVVMLYAVLEIFEVDDADVGHDVHDEGYVLTPLGADDVVHPRTDSSPPLGPSRVQSV